MRPSPWITGLLTCTVRSVGAQRIAQRIPEPMQTPTPVTFVALQTALAAAPRVLFRGKENQKLNWKVQEGFTVDSVEIWNNDEAIGRWQQDKGKTPIRKTGRGLQSKDESLQDTTIIALNVTNFGDASNLLFNIPATRNGEVPLGESQTWADNLDKALHVKLLWYNGLIAGAANDSHFVVASDEGEPAISKAKVVLEAAAATAGSTPAVSTTTTFAKGDLPTLTASTSDPNGLTDSTNSPAPSPPSDAASSRLDPGAIAGIAVGAVALLVIVGALVWFFCFRRRKQHSQTHQAGYGQDAGTRAMMVDKEVPGVSESSPHSAYGDDGGRLHDRSSTAMDSSYAPYRDHTPAMTPAPVAHASPATTNAMPSSQTHLPQHATSAQTPPATTQYAHLVEEGMTPDEIRRLEEEERALDQDIEASRVNH